MKHNCNDIELSQWRQTMRDAYSRLDGLTAAGEADSLWIEYHRISNAAEKAKERLNRIKWPDKPATGEMLCQK